MMYPEYVKPSLDATVVWGSIDFRFKNNRETPIKIVAPVKNGVASKNIPHGTYKCQITADGYYSYENDITVSNSQKEKHIELVKKHNASSTQSSSSHSSSKSTSSAQSSPTSIPTMYSTFLFSLIILTPFLHKIILVYHKNHLYAIFYNIY